MALMKRTAAPTAAAGSAAGRFQYRARSPEEVKQRANRALGRESILKADVDTFIPPAGDNAVRFLPPTWAEAQHYGVDVYVHYGIGPDKNAYLCLDKMKGEACPLCEARSHAAENKEEALAKHLRPNMRVIAWAVNRKDENKGPLVWSMAAGLDKDVVNCSKDQQSGEWLQIDHPEQGHDVFFKRVGTDEKTEYTGIQVGFRPSPLSDDPAKAQRWLDYAAQRPLPDLLNFKTYDELQAAFTGTTPERREDTKGGPARGPASGAAPAAASAPAAPVRKRGAAAPTAAAPAAAAAAQAPAQAAVAGDELPSYDEIHQLDEAALEGMIKELKLEIPADGHPDAEMFTTLQGIQDWVCKALGIEAPQQATATAPAGETWQEKLKRMRGGK